MRAIEFIRIWLQYRKYHSDRYAAKVAWQIAIKGASF